MPSTTSTRVTLPSDLDLTTGPRFATRSDCTLALALLPAESHPDHVVGLAYPPVAGEATYRALRYHLLPTTGRVLSEGPRCYVELSPGVLAVRRTDPARAERARQRQVEDERAHADLLAAMFLRGETPPEPGVSSIRVWSRRSRARMRRRMAELDYPAAVEAVGEGWALGMLTLTYPGEWLSVAGSADLCIAHLQKFRKRFERRWGPLYATWKREFQARGAPHFHLGGLFPTDPEFLTWVSVTWAEVVGHADADERAAHRRAGTRLDFARGRAATDPRRFADYFAKEGAARAKEYQNEPPAEWDPEVGVGRFWGYWRFQRLVVAVEVAPDVAGTVVRTARRWVESRSPRMRVQRWRSTDRIDPETGEVVTKWRKRWTSVPVRRFQRQSGFMVHSDAPGLLEALSRAATGATTPRRGVPGRRVGSPGLGPVGFLP